MLGDFGDRTVEIDDTTHESPTCIDYSTNTLVSILFSINILVTGYEKPSYHMHASPTWYNLSSNLGPHSLSSTDLFPFGMVYVWCLKEI